jgi:hypothetical protein
MSVIDQLSKELSTLWSDKMALIDQLARRIKDLESRVSLLEGSSPINYPIYDGGDAATSSWEATIDGGDAETTVFTTLDGGES